jgi:hypothetical protein
VKRIPAIATIAGVGDFAAHPAVFAMCFLTLLLYLGVILPAVWSKDEKRRRDARAVLQQILSLFSRQ